MNLSPIKIDPQGNSIFIEWSNHEAYTVPYFELRFHCPCANCVDEHTGKRTLTRDKISNDVRPTSVVPVGRYALQIGFSDKHTTGIYAYDTLYKICKDAGVLAKA